MCEASDSPRSVELTINVEIPEEGGQFRVPGVGRVNTLHHQESRNHEMRNTEISEEEGRFRIPRVGDVKNSYYRSPKVAKPKVAKCDIVKCQRFHFRASDTGIWSIKNSSPQERRSVEK
jgi:hypothetical protein